jgi:putative hydrolase of the HAD superfamily
VVILFDIDGTLIDHDSAERAAVADLHGRLGRTEPFSVLLSAWKTAFDRHYARYLAGELTIEQQRRERFREALDTRLSDDAADRLSAFYLSKYLDRCQIYPDVVNCLDEVSGFSLGIISNGERGQQ